MGLILIIFIFTAWVGLTLILHWFVEKLFFAIIAYQAARINILFIMTVFWFGASFWYAGGRLYYYDWLVDRMCAADGGVAVYETVLVSKEKYKDVVGGIVNFEKIKSTDEYKMESERYYYRTGWPDIERNHNKIVRISDGKVLGEFVFYSRRGGNFPGPWHGSSYRCPQHIPNLTSLIFLKK